MGYDTFVVSSVVIIPRIKDYRANMPENTRKGAGRKDSEKDFASILRQAMK